jgi:hypothetical protein
MVTYQPPPRGSFRIWRAVIGGLRSLRQGLCRHSWRPNRTNYGHSICKHCGAVNRI